MEETVIQDPAVVETAAAVTVAAVETEVKPPTLAETEKAYRESFDKAHGRDMAKLFPSPVAKVATKEEVKAEPEVKTELKAEVKTEVKEPEKRPMPKTGAGRLKLKLELAREANTELKARIAALEKPQVVEIKQEVKAAVEPERKDFASDADYFQAIRKFDKEQLAAETKKATETRAAEDEQRNIAAKFEQFAAGVVEAKKRHPDWDEKAAASKVTFEPVLQGVLLSADPELLYHLASNQREAKNLNDLGETAVVAVGNSDNIAGLLMYLGANPTDIDKLNSMSPVKAQTFIGRLEAKIEAEAKAKAEADVKRTSTGADDKATKPVAAATEEVKTVVIPPVKVQTRVRPEPPAKLTGSVPSPSNWSDPTSMSLSERERLFKEDPKYARRR